MNPILRLTSAFTLPLAAAAIVLTSASPGFASEATHLEALGKDMRVTLRDRFKSGERPSTALEAGTAGQVHVEYLDMPDESWCEVRWIVRFPIGEWQGKRAKTANLTLLLYTILGERDPLSGQRLKIEFIEGAQGEEITPGDRVMAGNDFVEVELPGQLPADIVTDVTNMLNTALQTGQRYIAFRLSATSDSDHPGSEAAGRLYFTGENNPEGWTRGDLPSLNIVWEP